jgi:hypothetical protein
MTDESEIGVATQVNELESEAVLLGIAHHCRQGSL